MSKDRFIETSLGAFVETRKAPKEPEQTTEQGE